MDHMTSVANVVKLPAQPEIQALQQKVADIVWKINSSLNALCQPSVIYIQMRLASNERARPFT